MDFKDPSMLNFLEACTPEQLNALPYGVVKMTHNGIIKGYNQAQSDLTTRLADDVIGQDFFNDVAPCTNHYMVSEQFKMHTTLDKMLHYTFSHNMIPTTVKLRLLKGKSVQFLLAEEQVEEGTNYRISDKFG